MWNVPEDDLTCSLRPLAPGLNFLSDAYFVTVRDDKEKSKTVFAKVPPQADPQKRMMMDILEDAKVIKKLETIKGHLTKNLKGNIVTN